MASQNNDETMPSNAKRIQMMFEAVIFCARQGIHMKGQTKKPFYHYSEEEQDDPYCESSVEGLIKLFLNVNNVNYKSKELSNSVFLTKKTQDRILETCREMLNAKLVAEIKEAKFFSLVAEKMLPDDDSIRVPLFVRFVDKDLKIREEFLQYVACGHLVDGETLGETFSKNIIRVITELGLSMEFCRGVNFDHMRFYSCPPEAAAKIQSVYEKAIYVHNSSDLLNVCIASTCELRSVSMMLYNMQFTTKLFTENEKITEILESKIKEVMPESEHARLIELCHTNWGTTLQQYGNLVELFPAVIAAYDEIQEGGSSWRLVPGNDRSRAHSCWLMMTEFQYIICLVIVTNLLELTHDLHEELQKVCYDSSKIGEKVSELLAKLDELKSQINEKHTAWYEQAIAFAKEIIVDPAKTEIYSKNKTDPRPDESISDHYLKLITLPFLDHIRAQIDLRFSEASLVAFDGLAIMPSNVLANPESWKVAAERFLKKYEDDQPLYHTYFSAELGLWQTMWTTNPIPVPETALKLLSGKDLKLFIQLFTGFKIFKTMPLTPVESERVMPFVNEQLCFSSLSDNSLNALALLSISGKDLKIEEVIECYNKKYKLPLILDDD